MDLSGFITARKTLILAIVIVLLGLSLPAYLTYDYYENDPGFCTSCHLMNGPYELWRSSGMHTVTCHACHEMDIPAALNLVYTALVYDPQEIATHAEVQEETCLDCHASGNIIYPQIVNEVGHETHYFHQEEASCFDCHSKSLHRFVSSDDVCQECHDETQKTAGMVKLDCKDCHTYTSKGKMSFVPQRIECLDCHARGETILAIPEGAHQDSVCSTCHELHIDSEPIECVSCHAKDELKGLHQFPIHNDCLRCHASHEKSDVRTVCTFCHVDKITHNEGVDCNLCHNFKE